MKYPTASPPLFFYLLVFSSTFLLSSTTEVMAARLPDIYWNSTNPIFRIDNTDHIIDVNRGNVAYEYDQINIICPMYSKGTREDDIETYIIYNVSKEEYDSCHIANPAVARTIAVCDKPYLNRYYTITFRPFTPQPGGLEFRPGQDYYFIALSAKPGDPNPTRHCHKYHMKVVFKVCCKRPQQQPTAAVASNPSRTGSVSSTTAVPSTTVSSSTPSVNQGPLRHYGIATYPGVIINPNSTSSSSSSSSASSSPSSSILPAVRLNPNTSSSSISSSRSGQTAGTSNLSASYSPNTSFNKRPDAPFNHSQMNGAGVVGVPPGPAVNSGSYLNRVYPHYNHHPPPQPMPNNNVLSTVRPSLQSSHMSTSRTPHAPYHPYHPSQLTSTPTPHWWRPHYTKQRHNYDASRPADQGYAYKKASKDRRPNDIREKSDGLNSASISGHQWSNSTSQWRLLVTFALVHLVVNMIFSGSSSSISRSQDRRILWS